MQCTHLVCLNFAIIQCKNTENVLPVENSISVDFTLIMVFFQLWNVAQKEAADGI